MFNKFIYLLKPTEFDINVNIILLLFVFRSNRDHSDFQVCSQCQLAQDNQISTDDHIQSNACLLCKRAIQNEKNNNSKQHIKQLSPFNQIFTCARETEEYDNETCATIIKSCAKYKREEKIDSLQKTSDLNANKQPQKSQKEQQQKSKQQKSPQQQSKPVGRSNTREHSEKKTTTKPKPLNNIKKPARKSPSPNKKGKSNNTNISDNKASRSPPLKQTPKKKRAGSETKQNQNKNIKKNFDYENENETALIDEENKQSPSSSDSSESFQNKNQAIQETKKPQNQLNGSSEICPPCLESLMKKNKNIQASKTLHNQKSFSGSLILDSSEICPPCLETLKKNNQNICPPCKESLYEENQGFRKENSKHLDEFQNYDNDELDKIEVDDSERYEQNKKRTSSGRSRDQKDITQNGSRKLKTDQIKSRNDEQNKSDEEDQEADQLLRSKNYHSQPQSKRPNQANRLRGYEEKSRNKNDKEDQFYTRRPKEYQYESQPQSKRPCPANKLKCYEEKSKKSDQKEQEEDQYQIRRSKQYHQQTKRPSQTRNPRDYDEKPRKQKQKYVPEEVENQEEDNFLKRNSRKESIEKRQNDLEKNKRYKQYEKISPPSKENDLLKENRKYEQYVSQKTHPPSKENSSKEENRRYEQYEKTCPPCREYLDQNKRKYKPNQIREQYQNEGKIYDEQENSNTTEDTPPSRLESSEMKISEEEDSGSDNNDEVFSPYKNQPKRPVKNDQNFYEDAKENQPFVCAPCREESLEICPLCTKPHSINDNEYSPNKNFEEKRKQSSELCDPCEEAGLKFCPMCKESQSKNDNVKRISRPSLNRNPPPERYEREYYDQSNHVSQNKSDQYKEKRNKNRREELSYVQKIICPHCKEAIISAYYDKDTIDQPNYSNISILSGNEKYDEPPPTRKNKNKYKNDVSN